MNTLRSVLVVGVFALSGCSVLVPDFSEKTPEPAPEEQVTTPETTGPVSKKPWAKACEAYNAEQELTDHQFKLEEEGDISCDWKQDSDTYLTVGIYQYLAFENSMASKATVSDTTVGSRKAFQIAKETSSETSCKIAVPADGGHLSVNVHSKDFQESCDLAKKIAEKIEPTLPGGK